MAVTGALGTVSREALRGGLTKVTIPWTSDAAAGSVGEIAVILPAGTLLQMRTDPDAAAAPTAAYDITLLDSLAGADVLFGSGADRSATAIEIAVPVMGTTTRRPYLEGGSYYPTIAAAGNSTEGVIELLIGPGLAGS